MSSAMEQDQPLKVPGFGLPLTSIINRTGKRIEKETDRFPHAIADYYPTNGITLREKCMMEFINQITDKPRWQEKVYDEKIVEKWRREACGSKEEQETSPKHLSKKAFDYCIEELKDKVAYHQKHGVVHVFDAEVTIVKTDVDDAATLCSSLIEAVQPLENVADLHKDWHPGSGEIVLDLMHPSLFPLEYGKTRVLPSGRVPLWNCNEYICRGEQCPIPEELNEDVESSLVSRAKAFADAELRAWGSYQWLPSDVHIAEDGSAKIESYINNLHPQHHPGLYNVLETAVESAVPLWNECLSFFHSRLRIQVDSCGVKDFRYPGRGTDDDTWKEFDLIDWLEDHAADRKLEQPEPNEEFVTFEDRAMKDGLRRVNLSEDFSNRIQVIFKLANIHLTPDKPHYGGSEWHVEGALNERICATALVYYDQDNVEDSYLAFRHEVNSEGMMDKPLQFQYQACEDMFGIENEGAAVQDLGKVATKKGRILAFPNILQHRVLPFGLVDPTKPGYRKILAMFLVDPHIQIMSTSNVPPQRRDWWADEVRLIRPFADLPVELFDRLMHFVEDFPISFESACEAREALMAERGRVKREFDSMLDDEIFFFCEH